MSTPPSGAPPKKTLPPVSASPSINGTPAAQVPSDASAPTVKNSSAPGLHPARPRDDRPPPAPQDGPPLAKRVRVDASSTQDAYAAHFPQPDAAVRAAVLPSELATTVPTGDAPAVPRAAPTRPTADRIRHIIPVARDAGAAASARRSPPPELPSHPIAASPVTPAMLVQHSDTTVSSGQPRASTPSRETRAESSRQTAEATPTAAPSSKEGRRVWNRRALERSGISIQLLRALDFFVDKVPPIPTHLDPSRKMYVRNMRGWILHLALPLHADVWDELVKTLRTDSSVTALGPHWDHDLCRFLLGVLVLDNQTRRSHQNHPKPSRQAVNNAIKRELTCPTESGTSSRGKTFRDLFREKCLTGGVKLPPLEDSARTKRSAQPSERTSHPETTRPSAAPLVLPSVRITSSTGEDSYVSLPAANDHTRPSTAQGNDKIELDKLRESCPRETEWGHTAWWNLKSDPDVQRLPDLLVAVHLFELRALLLDFRWIVRTFKCVDFSKGMHQVPTVGYDVMLEHCRRRKVKCSQAEIEGFRLIRNAIILILPILSKDPSCADRDDTFNAHVATQLVGRLLDLKRRFSNIASLLQSIESHAPRPWLRPIARCFQQPRTDIKLAVPSNGVLTPHLIVLSEDGTLLATSGSKVVERKMDTALSGPKRSPSQDTPKRKLSSIRIWDVQSGKCVCKGPEIPNLVRHLSLARDNSCVVLETVDGLFFWHLDKSEEIWKISPQVEATPRLKSLSSITPTVGAKQVLTTHRSVKDPTTQRIVKDAMIVLWNTQTGQRLDCFDSVKSNANCVDVSASGNFFASGHEDGFIHLWNVYEKNPVLSFKNEGLDVGQQQVVGLSDVNQTDGSRTIPTISLSFYEEDEDRWLTAVSAHKEGNNVVRVWLLPPRHISQDQWKSFVSSRRTAVLRCPRVRDVQWSRDGSFFTGGDDGVARMWKKAKNGRWRWYAIVKEDEERSSDISTVLLSSGKRSRFVATYVTKSPYVTVWDTSELGYEGGERASLYRPYFPLVGASVDSTDIKHLRYVEQISADAKGREVVAEPKVSGGFYGLGDNDNMIGGRLDGYFFRKLDPKYTAAPEGEMQPWLRMQPRSDVSGMGRHVKPLKVCFEQPVVIGKSGVFKVDVHRGKNAMIGEIVARPDGGADSGEGGSRRGMVAALQDGSLGIFELEDEVGSGGLGSGKEEARLVGNGAGEGGKKEEQMEDKASQRQQSGRDGQASGVTTIPQSAGLNGTPTRGSMADVNMRS